MILRMNTSSLLHTNVCRGIFSETELSQIIFFNIRISKVIHCKVHRRRLLLFFFMNFNYEEITLMAEGIS